MVCCKQLLCKLFSFSLVNTTAITFSAWPFPTSHSHFLACPFSCSEEGGDCIVWLQPFPAESTGVIHLVEHRWTHPMRKRNMNTDPSRRIFFLPSKDYELSWVRGKLRETGKKKTCQSARLTVYEMDWGDWVLEWKWKTWHMRVLDYHDMILLSWVKEVTLQNILPLPNQEKI